MVASLYAISSVTIAVALNGLLKELVADELLAEANGVLQTVREGLRMGGPLAGAALFVAFGGAVVAAIDAVTFFVAAVAIGLMRLREALPKRTELHWLGEMTAGIRHITAEPALRRIVTAGAAGMLVIGINESVVFAVVDQGPAPATGVRRGALLRPGRGRHRWRARCGSAHQPHRRAGRDRDRPGRVRVR